MLNGRLYRAAFAPFLLALVVAAFSLQASPQPYTSALAPDAFEGAAAFTELETLAHKYPLRPPGSSGDDALARVVAEKLERLGGTAGGGFSVSTYHVDGQTIDGERQLSMVVAQRPGARNATPILIVAHRDAAARGSQAELSGTAALLELAQVFSTRETQRTIVLASTSGGSGGDAAAAQLAAEPSAFGLHGPFDAAIVIGDVAGVRTRTPMVVPFSQGVGSAPLELQLTLDGAIHQETGFEVGAPSAFGQLAHLAFPLTVGEQGVLNAAGVPAVLMQVSGEDGPAALGRDPVSAERLEAFGRAALSAVDALDTAPDVPRAMQTGVVLQHKSLPAWTLELLVATLLFPTLLTGLDALARMRRRRVPVGRWVLWTLSCALPFVSCALFAYVLGWLGVLGAAPGTPALPGAMPLGGRAITALVAIALTFALAWLLWSVLLRRLGWSLRPHADAAALGSLLVALGVGAVALLANPFAALLALPALHAWLALAEPRLRPRRALALPLVALGALPLALLTAFYVHQLHLGVGETMWMGLLLLAGGHIGPLGALVWSVAFGCVVAVALSTAQPLASPGSAPLQDGVEVTIRGPLSYAGPGSLGGTESALRR